VLNLERGPDLGHRVRRDPNSDHDESAAVSVTALPDAGAEQSHVYMGLGARLQPERVSTYFT
jgi:hypothetical protein